MLVTLDNDGAQAHSFGRAAPFRVGVEEELFLVDPVTLGVTLSTESVLERGEPCVVGEMCDELRQVERILAEGNGATRRRRAFEAGGMPAVLAVLAAESRGADTAADIVAA